MVVYGYTLKIHLQQLSTDFFPITIVIWDIYLR